MIDDNEKEKKAMELFRQKRNEEAHALQDEFLAEVEASGIDHCTCKVKDCKYHGKCKECVIIHRGHNDHLPHCMKGWKNERTMTTTDTRTNR